MPPRPVGTQPQAQSLTAASAFIASQLAGVGARERNAWLLRAKVAVRRNGIERARTRLSPALRSWLLVDEWALDLEKALVVFPGSGQRRPRLLASLRATQALRHLLTTRSRRDVLCIAVFERSDRDDLFAELESLGEPFLWDDLVEDDRVVEADMWTGLMHRAAAREGFAPPR